MMRQLVSGLVPFSRKRGKILQSASVGGLILFGGGDLDGNGYDPSNVVDIYNTATGNWSIEHLSQARTDLTAVSAGGEVFFAGGQYYNGKSWVYSNVVDIYDATSDTWSTTTLSLGRSQLTATAVGNEVFFAGGIENGIPSNVVDIFTIPEPSPSSCWASEPSACLPTPADGTRRHPSASEPTKSGHFPSGAATKATATSCEVFQPSISRTASASIPSLACSGLCGWSRAGRYDGVVLLRSRTAAKGRGRWRRRGETIGRRRAAMAARA